MLNQMFGLAFTNTPYPGFTVWSPTNLSLPLSNWTLAGPPVESPPGQFQFFDASASSNGQQFYTLSSP